MRLRKSALIAQKMFACWAVLMLTPYAQAQFMESLFSPKVTVQIKHPPSLPLQTERIVFGPASGECSEELLDNVLSDLVNNGIEVVDRQNFDLILAEQQLSLDGRFNKATALKLGEIIGPSVMLSIKVQKCIATQKHTSELETRTRKDEEGNSQTYNVRQYQATTSVSFKTSIRAVDLATGRIFTARTLEYSPKDTNISYEDYPEFPDELTLKEQAVSEATVEIDRMFIPWVEKKSLTFYKNKKCGLKKAHQALKAGAIEQTLTLSKTNLDNCKIGSKIKPKVLSQAYYNLGMTYMILGQYGLALENFTSAEQIRPGGVVREAISNTKEAWNLKRAFAKIEENAILVSQEKEAQASAVENAALTNSDIIAMSAQGLPVAVILKLLSTRPSRFDISGDALIALASAKVDDSIIVAMIGKAAE